MTFQHGQHYFCWFVLATARYLICTKIMLPMLEQYANYSLHDLFLKQKTTHGQLFIVRSISDFSHISCA